MSNPFEVLGISASATAEQVRHAYHLLARKYHPDQFQDPEQQRIAQEKMVVINLAYQEALKLANARAVSPYTQEVTCEDAVKLSRKMLRTHSPESALRQLLRASTKNAEWFYQQGLVLMEMEQYESAHQSFREAVRRDPANNQFRRGALDAAVALKHSQSLIGRIEKLIPRKWRGK